MPICTLKRCLEEAETEKQYLLEKIELQEISSGKVKIQDLLNNVHSIGSKAAG